MATIQRFEDLEIWQLAREYCKQIRVYLMKDTFSKDYKLVNQLNGSSGSVMDNISEGFDRGSRKEFIQFLGIAKGSCGESKSQLYRAQDRGYISKTEFQSAYELADTINKKIYHLINYLNNSAVKGNKFKDRVEEPESDYSNIEFPFDNYSNN